MDDAPTPAGPVARAGPFELIERLGSGSHGVVWRARHRGDGTPVAVKVLTGPKRRHERLAARLRAEARAVAGLRHPGIVSLFDYGRVSPEDADRSGARLDAGSPYLVMALMGANLAQRLPEVPKAGWGGVQRLLSRLLDALAHAHARGVVHRDLKPHNVLLAHGSNDLATCCLADFGLAVAPGAPGLAKDRSRRAGTLRYMAPEQLTGRWRELGPWTDLYGLGCTAFELVTGRPAFDGPSASDLAEAHVRGQRQRFEPVLDVPEGLRAWIHRLTEPDAADRFRRAPDAARALAALGQPVPRPRPGPRAPARSAPTHTISGEAPSPAVPLRSEAQIAVRSTDPWLEVPPTWRRAEGAGPHPWSLAGLRLFGLRPVELVGREAERDALWASLVEVARHKRPAARVLAGPGGVGKSHLARWLCERVRELGVAEVIEVSHGGPIAGPLDGLVPALVRHLRCVGLAQPEVEARLAAELLPRTALERENLRALAAMLVGAWEGAQRPLERFNVLAEALAQLGRRRPILVWLDDVIAAGAPGEALGPLLQGAQLWNGTGDYNEAAALLELAERAVDACGAGAQDPRRVWLMVLQARHVGTADVQRASELALRAEAVAQARGLADPEWGRRWAWARIERVRLEWLSGRFQAAATLLEEALPVTERLEDGRLLVEARQCQGQLKLRRGDLDGAEVAFAEALARAEGMGDRVKAASLARWLALPAKHRGDLETAKRHAEHSVAICEAIGARARMGDGLTVLGEIARYRGELEEAEALYRAAIRAEEAGGTPDAAVGRLNLGMVLMQRGRFEAAREVFERCLAQAQATGVSSVQGASWLGLLVCAGARGDWPAWDRWMALSRGMLERTGWVDADIGLSLKLAGESARAAGDPERGRAALELALGQYRQLGRDADCAAIEALLARAGAVR